MEMGKTLFRRRRYDMIIYVIFVYLYENSKSIHFTHILSDVTLLRVRSLFTFIRCNCFILYILHQSLVPLYHKQYTRA